MMNQRVVRVPGQAGQFRANFIELPSASAPVYGLNVSTV